MLLHNLIFTELVKETVVDSSFPTIQDISSTGKMFRENISVFKLHRYT